MKTSPALALAFALILPCSVSALDYNAFKTGVYDVAMNATVESIQKAVKTLDAELKAEPGRPEALLLKGSLLAKQADLEFWFWDKLAHVNDGIDLMAKGMDRLNGTQGRNVSDELRLTLTMVRGITSAYLPDTFQQGQVALREMERSRANPLWSQVPARFRAEMLGLLARRYEQGGNKDLARTTLAEAVQADAAIANKAYHP